MVEWVELEQISRFLRHTSVSMFINLEEIMRKVFVIIAIFSVFMWFVSCSDSKKTEIDDQVVNDNSTVDDTNGETDEETTEDDVVQDNSVVPDNNIEPDNNVTNDDAVETDETVIPDDETTDTIETDEELIDSDEEVSDHDTTKPEPPSCPENTFGLTIRTSYNNGTENVDGGGVVNRDPAGTATIDEKTTCYALNTVVTLTVVPDLGYVFSSWKGKGVAKLTGEFPTFSITMTETTTLRAEFAEE